MAFTRPLLLCGALVLAGCGSIATSKANPMNWFGGSTSQKVDPRSANNPLIPATNAFKRPKAVYQGQLVDQIAELRIERRPGGAVIHVVGVTDVIGYYDTKLEAENDGKPVKGVLSYALKAVRPAQTVGVGGEAARRINVATFVTDQDLAGVRSIVVKGARNQRTTRRR